MYLLNQIHFTFLGNIYIFAQNTKLVWQPSTTRNEKRKKKSREKKYRRILFVPECENKIDKRTAKLSYHGYWQSSPKFSIKHLISYLYKSKPPQLKTGLFIKQRAQNVFHLAKCLQSILLNHKLGHQRVRQLVFLQALFLPDHQALDRNLFVKFHGEKDTDPTGHYFHQAQEDNHNMQEPLKICLLIYLIDIYWAAATWQTQD